MITVTNNDIKSINAALIANNEALKKEVAQTLEIENVKHADEADHANNATLTYTQYCTNDANFSNNVASITVDTPTGLTMSAGSTLKVCFSKSLQDANEINEVQLTYGGVTATIWVARSGSLVRLASHRLRGGYYNGNLPHKVYDPYTTLELMYDGTHWIIMGDTIVCSYVSSSCSYTVWANGLISQIFNLNATEYKSTPLTFWVEFKHMYTINGIGATTDASFNNTNVYALKCKSLTMYSMNIKSEYYGGEYNSLTLFEVKGY